MRMILSSIAVLVLASCEGSVGFPIEEEISEQRVEGSPVGELLGDILSIPFEVDLSAATEARNTGPAQHVYLTGLSLGITVTDEPAGDTDDFDFVDSIEIFVESGEPGSALPRVRVAHLDSVPRGVRRIELELDGVDLIEYVRQGAVMTSSARGRMPPDDVTFDGVVQLRIDVL